MKTSVSYTITKDDIEIDVECDVCVSGGDPGNYTGLPENCYPAEAPEVEVGNIEDAEGNKYDFDSLSESEQEGIVEKAMECSNEPDDEPYDYRDD